MKTKYKYVHFEREEKSLTDGEEQWVCYNNKDQEVLSYIYYDSDWGEWIEERLCNCKFNSDCDREVADFLDQLNIGRIYIFRKHK